MFTHWPFLVPELQEIIRLVTDPFSRTQLATTCSAENGHRAAFYATHFSGKRSHRRYVKAVATYGSDAQLYETFVELTRSCEDSPVIGPSYRTKLGHHAERCRVALMSTALRHGRDSLVLWILRLWPKAAQRTAYRLLLLFNTPEFATECARLLDPAKGCRPALTAPIDQYWALSRTEQSFPLKVERYMNPSTEIALRFCELAVCHDDTALAMAIGVDAWHLWNLDGFYDFPHRLSLKMANTLLALGWKPKWQLSRHPLEIGYPRRFSCFLDADDEGMQWLATEQAPFERCPGDGVQLGWRALIWLADRGRINIREKWVLYSHQRSLRACHAIALMERYHLPWYTWTFMRALAEGDLAALLWLLNHPDEMADGGPCESLPRDEWPHPAVLRWLRDHDWLEEGEDEAYGFLLFYRADGTRNERLSLHMEENREPWLKLGFRQTPDDDESEE